MNFFESHDIKDYRLLIDSLIPDFDYIFLHSILQWCGLATDLEPKKFWQIWLVRENADGGVIGICGLYSLNEHTDTLWLGWLALVPQERNKHKGRKIMEFLYSKCKELDCKTLYAYVGSHGAPLNFYYSEGFSMVGSVYDFVYDNDLLMKDFESAHDFVICKEIL